MKQFLLIFLLFNTLILRGDGQVTIALSSGIINMSVNPDSFEIKGKATLKNTAKQTKKFVWQRNIISMSNNWQNLVCDQNQCWSNVNNSPDTIVLSPNGTCNLDALIRPNRTNGAATIEIKVTEIGNTANTVTGRYLFSSISINRELIKNSNTVRIYPNPTTDYFMLDDSTDIVERVVIYNIIGRQVKSYKALDNFKYSINDLPEGIYIIRLLNNGGNTVKTIRLNKSKVKA